MIDEIGEGIRAEQGIRNYNVRCINGRHLVFEPIQIHIIVETHIGNR